MDETKKHTGTFIEIDKALIKEIKSYTELNGLQLTKFINDLLKKAFMVEKYGNIPLPLKKQKEEPKMEPETPQIIEKEPEVVQEPPKQVKGKKIITY